MTILGDFQSIMGYFAVGWPIILGRLAFQLETCDQREALTVLLWAEAAEAQVKPGENPTAQELRARHQAHRRISVA